MKIPIFANSVEYKNNTYYLQHLFSDFAYYMSPSNDLGIYMYADDLKHTIYEDEGDKHFNETMKRYFQAYEDLYESDSIDNDYDNLIIEKISKTKNIDIKNLDIEYAKELLDSGLDDERIIAESILWGYNIEKPEDYYEI